MGDPGRQLTLVPQPFYLRFSRATLRSSQMRQTVLHPPPPTMLKPHPRLFFSSMLPPSPGSLEAPERLLRQTSLLRDVRMGFTLARAHGFLASDSLGCDGRTLRSEPLLGGPCNQMPKAGMTPALDQRPAPCREMRLPSFGGVR